MVDIKNKYDLIIKIKKSDIYGADYSQIKILWVAPGKNFFSKYLCIYPDYITDISDDIFFIGSDQNDVLIYNTNTDDVNQWKTFFLNDDNIKLKYLIINETNK